MGDLRSDLFLQINSTYYRLTRQRPAPATAKLAWRLEKQSSEIIDVAVMADGRLSCTCGDFAWKAGKENRDCKHIAALREQGLLPARRDHAR